MPINRWGGELSHGAMPSPAGCPRWWVASPPRHGIHASRWGSIPRFRGKRAQYFRRGPPRGRTIPPPLVRPQAEARGGSRPAPTKSWDAGSVRSESNHNTGLSGRQKRPRRANGRAGADSGAHEKLGQNRANRAKTSGFSTDLDKGARAVAAKTETITGMTAALHVPGRHARNELT